MAESPEEDKSPKQQTDYTTDKLLTDQQTLEKHRCTKSVTLSEEESVAEYDSSVAQNGTALGGQVFDGEGGRTRHYFEARMESGLNKHMSVGFRPAGTAGSCTSTSKDSFKARPLPGNRDTLARFCGKTIPKMNLEKTICLIQQIG